MFSESFPSLRKLLLLWLQAPAGGAAFAAQLLLDVWVSGGDLRSLSTGSHSWPLIPISSEVEPAGGRNRDRLGGGGGGGHNLLAVQQNDQLPIYINREYVKNRADQMCGDFFFFFFINFGVCFAVTQNRQIQDIFSSFISKSCHKLTLNTKEKKVF